MISGSKENKDEKDDRLIISRAEDALRSAQNRHITKSVGFLNPHMRSLILKNIISTSDVKTFFEGGYPDAERVMFICMPQYEEINPDDFISVIEVTGRDIKRLTHRDYLGSLMGLGITRENIGDILVGDEKSFMFVKPEIADYILLNLEKIGNCGVKLKRLCCSDAELPAPKINEIRATVASLRIDVIVATITNLSRAKTDELIKKGLVSINFEVVESVSKVLEAGALISIRGFGRAKIKEIGGITKKGKTVIIIEKYE